MATKEYMRDWHARHPEKAKLYREKSVQKRGLDYWRKANAKWKALNPEKALEKSRMDRAKRRARISGARVSAKYIQIKKISNWDTKICGICSLLIEGKYHIDHIVPLSRGGAHSIENLQIAHPFCNQSKHNRLLTIDNVLK